MKVTLKDIAKETGYSISTISRVLSNVGKISSKAREEILQAAQRLNYPTSRIAGYEVRKKNLNIALITDFHEGEFYASYYYGVERAASEDHVRLALLNVTDPRKNVKKFMTELLSDKYYDCAIIYIPELLRKDYEELLEVIPDSFPVVSNALIENSILSTITFDGYSGGHQAARLFYKRGYRRVGIVKGPANKAESRFRYNGFKDYVDGKPDMDLVWEYQGDFEFNSGVQSFYAMRESDSEPDAVFISNDFMATAFVDTAVANNVMVPDDIAVLGYDDLPMCRNNNPTISSVRTDFRQLGFTTIQTLKNRLSGNGQQSGMLSLIPVSINERESIAVKPVRA
ncbi:LacI family DNA-binding transcriptional regulator [Balneolales bacterium ANBcel1]|nr:LacI family DNA-binding transcriptional regulator [Balneolales bacterium ANBcel1]